VPWPLCAVAGAAGDRLLMPPQPSCAWVEPFSPVPDPKPGRWPCVTSGATAAAATRLYQAVLICGLGVEPGAEQLLHLPCARPHCGCSRQSQARGAGLDRQASAYASYRAETAAIIPGLPGSNWRH